MWKAIRGSHRWKNVATLLSDAVDPRPIGNRVALQRYDFDLRLNQAKDGLESLATGSITTWDEAPPGFSEKKPSLEALLGDFINESKSRTNFLESSITSHGKAIQNLEVQVSQITTTLNTMNKGALPRCTEKNPREECKAIILRSGKNIAHLVTGQIEEQVVLCPLAGNMNQGKKGDGSVSSKLESNFESSLAFMKEMLSLKKKFEKYEKVSLYEECSAILQKKLPQKLKDPGSFTIPCTRGILTKTGHRREDVLVKVGDFIFPVDFVVLDMEEDAEIPIILGWLFLATRRALIDVYDGKLTLQVNDQKVKFNIFHSSKPNEPVSLYLEINEVYGKHSEQSLGKRKGKEKCGRRLYISGVAVHGMIKPT
ncbi:uncharacterized protein LOC120077421 [Benincasa hispida]|uniref:uncharacterized protein LOC120077421 n=1 Tax=Benincasa hispida TaxID=102211 RepID=UPI0018FF803B|nr:uncharacterized protein LOC120077421 [Benincasa hispida]